MPAIRSFLASENGAVTVDWVVLTGAVTGLALAATAVVRGGLEDLASDLEAQLRTQQVSDAFVVFTSTHFDALYDAGMVTESQAEDFFAAANQLTNAEVLTYLEAGVMAFNDGTLTDTEIAQLVAVASVAIQRNVVDDQDLSSLLPVGY